MARAWGPSHKNSDTLAEILGTKREMASNARQTFSGLAFDSRWVIEKWP